MPGRSPQLKSPPAWCPCVVVLPVFLAMDVLDQSPRLIDLLTNDAGCSPDIGVFMTKPAAEGSLGMQSVSDFTSFFTEANYEDELSSTILDHTTVHGSRLELVRLR